jgi:5-formyltetrahydrofolate cyclo-ligase
VTSPPREPPPDVAGWRKQQRQRLIRALIPDEAALVSVYWPIRAEPDLRAWMRTRCERGGQVALPVAVALRQPMQFRAWRPDSPLARGLWQIPIPAEGPEVIPDVLIAPLVGYDPACYRLGYGGGFFDRTLARLRERGARPRVIGVGYASQALASIRPQPHDIPMDCIVTGTQAPLQRAAA